MDHFTQSTRVEEGKKEEEHANVLPLAHEEETIQLNSCSDLFPDHQDLSFAHAFQDPFTSWLQSSDHDSYLVSNHSFHL